MADPVIERFRWVWLVEGVGYFVLGVVTLALGGLAVFHWSVEQWTAGAHVRVVGIVAAAIALLGVFAFAARGKRPVLAVGAAAMWVGVMAYVLSGYGYSIPASWWP